jgi:hypothetical protein
MICKLEQTADYGAALSDFETDAQHSVAKDGAGSRGNRGDSPRGKPYDVPITGAVIA